MARAQVKERLSKSFNSGGLISGVRWLSLQKQLSRYYLEDSTTNAQQLLLTVNEVIRSKQ
jgi:hypothetical protein